MNAVSIATLVATVMVGGALLGTRRSGAIRRRFDELRPAEPMRARPWRRSDAGRRVRRRYVLAIAASMAALVVLGPLASLVGAGLFVTTRRAGVVLAVRRTRSLIEGAVPDAIELFVLLAHAGLTPIQAVHQLAATAPEATRSGFDAVTHRLQRGDTFADALGALPERLGPSMAGLADVVARSDRYGTSLAPMLESLAFEARAARRRRAEADARRLPIRLSFPLVVCTLPSFVLLAVAPAVIAALSSIRVPH